MSNTALAKTLDSILESIEEKSGDKKKPGSSRWLADAANLNIFVLDFKGIRDEIDKIAKDPKLKKLNNDVALPSLNKNQKNEVMSGFVKYIRAAKGNAKQAGSPEEWQAALDRAEAQAEGVRDVVKEKINVIEVHVVGNMNTVNKNKKNKLVKGLDAVWKSKKVTEEARQNMVKRAPGVQEAGAEDIGFQSGHGDFGLPASGVTALAGEAEFDKSKSTTDLSGSGADTEKSAKALRVTEKAFARYRRKTGIKLTHDMVLDEKGNLKKDFFFILSLQSTSGNQADAHDIESKARRQLIKDLKLIREFVFNETSVGIQEAITSVLLEGLTSKTRKALAAKGAKIRYRGYKPKKKIKAQGRATKREQKTVSDIISIHRGNTLQQLGVAASVNVNKLNKKTAAAGSKRKLTSPIATLNYINKNIAEELKKNMQSPGLVNRTGRFAESVRALKMIPAKGRKWPVMQYTYDREPYGVYEVGGGDRRWASKARDPRTVIGKTLREMAREQALSRFTTQRI